MKIKKNVLFLALSFLGLYQVAIYGSAVGEIFNNSQKTLAVFVSCGDCYNGDGDGYAGYTIKPNESVGVDDYNKHGGFHSSKNQEAKLVKNSINGNTTFACISIRDHQTISTCRLPFYQVNILTPIGDGKNRSDLVWKGDLQDDRKMQVNQDNKAWFTLSPAEEALALPRKIYSENDSKLYKYSELISTLEKRHNEFANLKKKVNFDFDPGRYIFIFNRAVDQVIVSETKPKEEREQAKSREEWAQANRNVEQAAKDIYKAILLTDKLSKRVELVKVLNQALTNNHLSPMPIPTK